MLLLDYLLVGDSGLEVLKVLREDRGLDLPVVMVTARDAVDDRVAALNAEVVRAQYRIQRSALLPAVAGVATLLDDTRVYGLVAGRGWEWIAAYRSFSRGARS